MSASDDGHTNVTKKKWTVQLPEEKDWKDSYPFHAAAQSGDVARLSSILSSQPASFPVDPSDDSDESSSSKPSSSSTPTLVLVNALDDDHWSPLMYASWYGHDKAVSLLLSSGASPSPPASILPTPTSSLCLSPNPLSTSALHLASGAGHIEVVRLLLAAGADSTRKNVDKQTPLQLVQELKPSNWQAIVTLLQSHKST